MFDSDSLARALAGLRFGQLLHFFQRVGSTNDEAKRLADSGAPEGTLVVADEQTTGRGRAARRWITTPGTALALSLILRPDISPAHAARLTMLAGLAGCEAIEQVARLSVSLKWPNDLLVNGKKVGGILVEAAVEGERLSHAVVGVGINVSFAPPPPEVDFPATSLEAEAGCEVNRLDLLRALLSRMEARYLQLTSESLFADWRARLALTGEPVVVRTSTGEIRGQPVDVDPDGALVVRLETGELLRVLAGDVGLRPPS